MSTYNSSDNYELTLDQYKLVDEVLDKFDFEKVYKTMTYLDWKWGVEEKVPNILQLYKQARHLLKWALDSRRYTKDEGETNVMAGGFQAIAYTPGHVELKFVLTFTDSEEMI